MKSVLHNRIAAVAVGSALIVSLGSVSAVAKDLVRSNEIGHGAVKKSDLAHDSVGRSEIIKGSIGVNQLSDWVMHKLNHPGKAGKKGPKGDAGPEGKEGPRGPQGPSGSAGNAADVFGGVDAHAETDGKVGIEHIGGSVLSRKTDLISITLDPGIYLVSAYGMFDRLDAGDTLYKAPSTDTYGALVLWTGETFGDFNQGAGTYFTGAISRNGRIEATTSGSRLLTVTATTTLHVSGFGYNEAQGFFGSVDDASGMQFTAEAQVSAVKVGNYAG